MKQISFPKGRAWIELNMDNLLHNVGVLQDILPAHCKLMPAVKANAYGHGAINISRALNKLGIKAFCVASVMEGVELRKGRVKGEILILGYTHPQQFPLLKHYRLTQTVIDYEYAEKLNAYGKKCRVHISVDTGMKRLGEFSENIERILPIFACENLVVDGIYSHFSGQSDEFTQIQIDRFNGVLQKLKERGVDLPKAHLQGSYGVLKRPDLSFDYARVGIALYGAVTPGEMGLEMEQMQIELRPVLSVKTRVTIVKEVYQGEAVGYGDVFVAKNDMKIAVLSIGYADGIPRALSCGVGKVLIDGEFAPIVGYVCMDQIIIDVTHIDYVKQGDVATIIGRNDKKEIPVWQVAKQAATIPNEILSRLGNRLASPKHKSVPFEKIRCHLGEFLDAMSYRHMRVDVGASMLPHNFNLLVFLAKRLKDNGKANSC